MRLKNLFLSLILTSFVVIFFKSTIFCILSENLNNVILYPNPVEAKEGQSQITFDNLTANIRIRIYKITGDLILDKSISTTNGKYIWDLKNDDGCFLAHGVYIYVLTAGNGQKTTGKFAVLK